VKNSEDDFLALGLPLQLRTLILSPRQKFTQNPDVIEWYWREIFFWTEGLLLFNQLEWVWSQVSSLEAKIPDDFWQGSIPAQFFKGFPRPAKFTPAQVAEYCRVKQSNGKAADRLIIKARWDKLSPKGNYSQVRLGEARLAEEKFLLNAAAKAKSVKRYYLPQFISEAAKQNNVRFFIRLGKVLQSRKKVSDMDWTKCDPVACFLVENWCGWREYDRRFPALCFFSDIALADFCSAMLGRKSGNPSIDSIRQWRRRLGLKQTRHPKISKIRLEGNNVLFVGR
jgi:hypothetical protein